jgi:hypothetical protein
VTSTRADWMGAEGVIPPGVDFFKIFHCCRRVLVYSKDRKLVFEGFESFDGVKNIIKYAFQLCRLNKLEYIVLGTAVIFSPPYLYLASLHLVLALVGLFSYQDAECF